jgi:hypothetical protein
MTKIKPTFFLGLAVASLMLVGQTNAQECSSCDSCSSCSQAGSYQTGGGAYQTVFGYPTQGGCQGGCGGRTGCLGGGCSGRFAELRARHQQTAEINDRTAKRNEAWPKPFNCASRQLYFRMWENMIDQGFEEQCVLSAVHFDAETNELNRHGRHTVAGIMQNMPTARKHVFINQDVDRQLNDARMASVKETINTFYGTMGPAQVSFSTKLPSSIRGPQAERIQNQFISGMPAPIIPISSGEGVSAAVGN